MLSKVGLCFDNTADRRAARGTVYEETTQQIAGGLPCRPEVEVSWQRRELIQMGRNLRRIQVCHIPGQGIVTVRSAEGIEKRRSAA
jgi:hypothetical protein